MGAEVLGAQIGVVVPWVGDVWGFCDAVRVVFHFVNLAGILGQTWCHRCNGGLVLQVQWMELQLGVLQGATGLLWHTGLWLALLQSFLRWSCGNQHELLPGIVMRYHLHWQWCMTVVGSHSLLAYARGFWTIWHRMFPSHVIFSSLVYVMCHQCAD